MPALRDTSPPPRFGKPSRRGLHAPAGGVELAGRAVATVVPVALMTIGWNGPRLLLFAVAAFLWILSVNVGIGSSPVSLASLGPGVSVGRGAALGLVSTWVLGSWVPELHVSLPRSLLVGSGVFALVTAWEKWPRSRLRVPTRLLVVGPQDAGVAVERELELRRERRFVLVGIVDDTSFGDDRVAGRIADLPEVIDSLKPDLVAIAPGANRPATFTQLLELSERGFRVLELAHFYEYAFGSVPVRDLTGAWFMSVLHIYQRPYSRAMKRSCDVVGSFLLLLGFAPLFALIAVLVKLTPGPIVLRQVRVGEHGRLFTMYKFRSMRADAERPGEAVWAARGDPRVTAAGQVIRRLRLDELPQIVNVFKGDMSLVGPRPERPEFVELLSSVPFWTRRHLVKPGITGWAQVRHGYTSDTDGSMDKLSYDLWYVRHRSLTVDLAILVQTCAAVLWGDRPLAEAPAARPAAGQQVVSAASRPHLIQGER